MARRPRYTLYDLLDVSPFASADELQSAYWRAAKKFHPDTATQNLGPGIKLSAAEAEHQGALMKELVEAWDVLEDPESRTAYDASIGLRRPGPKRVFARNLSARLLRHRPAWRLQRRPLDTPDLTPLRRILFSLRDTLWATRLGQWLTLVAIVALWGLVGRVSPALQGPAELATLAIVALALARGGEPTPLFDALSLMTALVDVLWIVLRRLTRQAWRSVWSTLSTPRAQGSINLEQDSAWLEPPDPALNRADAPRPRRAGSSGAGSVGPRRPGPTRRR
jgi:hypothetical protein